MINDILNKYLNNEQFVKISNYSLDGIITLLGHLENPHKNFKSLHIAGTNGKGSTAFMLSKVLENSGYKTGLYISPHLLKINERIKINSHDIDDTLLYNYISKIDGIISNDSSISPTYFDILTAAAFKYFSDESVDIAIIETGLGGRLDSTNVITPEISIITDISMDHVGILGDTVGKIAKEKCGIIKPHIPVVTSNSNMEVIKIIEDYSYRNKSKLYSYNVNFYTQSIKRENNNFVFDYMSDNYKLKNIKLPLFPVHQVKNTAIVIETLKLLKENSFDKISDEIIYTELEKIVVPGRFQCLHTEPLVIYDPAHNYDAINNLINGLDTFYPEKNKLYIVSLMKDKADNKTLDLFKNSDVIYYILDDQRAYTPELNKFKIVTSDHKIIFENLNKADKDPEMIVFTGTFRIYNLAINMIEYLKQRIKKQ